MSIAISAAFGASVAGYLPVATAQDTSQRLERVEITGTALRRVDAETALPVTVIKTEDLVKQGVTTVEQAVKTIAANQSTLGVSQAIGATTGGKAEADLRGLGSNKTLVLLNGRRIANHAFDAASADLNAIPLSAIDRIEVLRDGASALYGTDAIGGVVNFILRRDFRGIEVSAEHQAPQGPGADVTRANVTAGFGSLATQRFNVLASLDWRKQRVLEAVHRHFSKTGVLGPSRADLTAGTSGTSFPGDLNGFEPSGPNCNPPSSLPLFSNPDNTGAFDSCRYDYTRDIDIIPENEQLTGLLRGSFALGSDHVASVEYLHANNKATSRVAPAPTSHLMPASSPFFPSGAPLTPGGIPDILNPGGPNVPGGVVNWRQVPAGKRTNGDDTTTQRMMLDLQGTWSGWDYRAAVGQSKNESTASVKRGYPNDDLMQLGVWNGIINPFGPQTPAGQAAIDAAQVVADTLIGENKVNFFDLRLSRDVTQMAAGPLSVALGVEYRKEKSFFEATDITAQLSSLGIDPDSDTKGDRDVKALFAEFAIPVMKNLDLTLAARYDRYSDFGNTLNPKVAVRYQPNRQLLLRGSYNKGFRAPTLYEIYQPFSLTFTGDKYDDPVLCPGGSAVPGASPGVVCGQQVLQRLSGPVGIGRPANALDPEKSDAFSIGFVFEPMQSLSFSVDFWALKLKDQIGGLPEQAIFEDPVKYASRFVRCSQLPAGPIPGQIDRDDIDVCLNFPTFDPIAYIDTPTENLGNLKSRGVDLSFAWRSGATPYGRWGFSIEGTYVDQYKYQRERGGEYFSAAGRYSDASPIFRWQHVATLTWGAGPWSAVLANRYKSGYTDQDEVNEVGTYSVYDVSASWTGVKNLTITAGILNVLDKDPPRTVQVTTFQRGYDPRFTDPRGRTYMMRVAYKFL
jgi:iron complex outermembrane receptor protein